MAAAPAQLTRDAQLERIRLAVEAVFGVDPRIRGKQPERVAARRTVLHLARKYTDRSYPVIGRFLGAHGSSTMVNGLEAFRKRLAIDAELSAAVAKAEEIVAVGDQPIELTEAVYMRGGRIVGITQALVDALADAVAAKLRESGASQIS